MRGYIEVEVPESCRDCKFSYCQGCRDEKYDHLLVCELLKKAECAVSYNGITYVDKRPDCPIRTDILEVLRQAEETLDEIFGRIKFPVGLSDQYGFIHSACVERKKIDKWHKTIAAIDGLLEAHHG